MQLVEVELDSGEAVIAETGAINYFKEGIEFETKWVMAPMPSKTILANCGVQENGR